MVWTTRNVDKESNLRSARGLRARCPVDFVPITAHCITLGLSSHIAPRVVSNHDPGVAEPSGIAYPLLLPTRLLALAPEVNAPSGT